jgi:hypothetical protein
MSSDYKDDIQRIAEELAFERHDMEFYELKPMLQQSIYELAISEYVNRMADRADYLRKAAREDELR